MNVCEPEMWLYMSSIIISWISSRTKEYIPPKSEDMCETPVHSKYLNRPRHAKHMSFLQWLRKYQHTAAAPKEYKAGNKLVSVCYASIFRDELFLHDLLMNYSSIQRPVLVHFNKIADVSKNIHADSAKNAFFQNCQVIKNAFFQNCRVIKKCILQNC